MMRVKKITSIHVSLFAMLVVAMGNLYAGDTGTSKDSGSITVPYTIDGINPEDVIEGKEKLKGNVIFNKGVKSKTITIKIKKNTKKGEGKDPKFSLGTIDDKKVTRNKDKDSVAIKLPDATTTTVAGGSSSSNECLIFDNSMTLYVYSGIPASAFGAEDKDDLEELLDDNNASGTGTPQVLLRFLKSYIDKGLYEQYKDIVKERIIELEAKASNNYGESGIEDMSRYKNNNGNWRGRYNIDGDPNDAYCGDSSANTYIASISLKQINNLGGDLESPKGEEYPETEFIYTVSLDRDAEKTVSIPYIITGISDDDIKQTLSGNIEIPKDKKGIEFKINPKGDVDVEEDETFTITLQEEYSLYVVKEAARSFKLGDKKSAIGIIVDNDKAEIATTTTGGSYVKPELTASSEEVVSEGKATLALSGVDKAENWLNLIIERTGLKDEEDIKGVKVYAEEFAKAKYVWFEKCDADLEKRSGDSSEEGYLLASSLDSPDKVLSTLEWTAPENKTQDRKQCTVNVIAFANTVSSTINSYIGFTEEDTKIERSITIWVKPKTVATAKSKQIEFNIVSDTKAEGTVGESEYVFTVRVIDGPVDKEITAQYTVTGTGSNPAEANDFVGGQLPQGTLTIPANAEGAPITIKVLGDNVKEETEQFTVTLSNPSSGVSIVENRKSSIGIIEDGNGGSSQSFAGQNACEPNPCANGESCSADANSVSGYQCTRDSVAGTKQKKEFKLVDGSRKFLLFDSRLIDGISLTQENSFTTAVNAAINCPNDKPFLCSDMKTCAATEDACTTTTTTTTTPAVTPEICGSGTDEDGDGLIDFADPDCTTPESIGAGNCLDTFDNDNDGFTDLADSDCIPEICGNFFDDDGDGDTDFFDSECTPTAESIGAGNCADGLDNDNDGLADTDAECSATTPLTTGAVVNDNDAFNDLEIVVDGGDNLTTVLDGSFVANSLGVIQFTGPGSGLIIAAPGVVFTGLSNVFDGANTVGFVRAGTEFEININLTITTNDDIVVNSLSGSNCGAGPC